VVLFVPAESLFSAALEGDHDLIVWAAEQTDFAGDPGVAHRAAAFGERELAAARADGERAENRRSRAGILFAGGQIHRTLRDFFDVHVFGDDVADEGNFFGVGL
jgi:hypothetical protein